MNRVVQFASRCGALIAVTALAARAQPPQAVVEQSGWGRGGVCYEIFVRSFYDSDGDGIGDLRGLTQKIDYINDGNPKTSSDLGATCLWLMPVAQSPSYHGYDVTNYYAVNRDYGTEADFRRLTSEAHRRGIRVLVDLVLNHSSSEHPYFQSALFDTSSPYRDWYLWSPAPKLVTGWGAPVWHKVESRPEYYYGLFWGGMPDLNLSNPQVKAEARKIARFWLEEMGVDGFRLDAVGHFFEAGDTIRHAAATHPWLRDYSSFIHGIAPNAFTIGEVADGTDALLAYYPDQLDAYFAFEVADAIVDGVNRGASEKIVAAVARAQRDLPPGRWSPFLRNHDQTRAMTDLNRDSGRAKVAATILMTLPGFPFLYFGEEIGMTGSKPDPRLRTPMHWSARPSMGFTSGTPWAPLQPDSLTANVAAQHLDASSLLNHYRRLIHLRAARPALSAGEFFPLTTGTSGALAYLRRTRTTTALVIVNLTGQRLTDVALGSPVPALAAGQYTATAGFGDHPTTTITIGASGQLPSSLAPPLEPFASFVFDLSRKP